MSTLTITFTDSNTITIANCEPEFEGADNTSFEMPDDDAINAVTAGRMTASAGALKSYFIESADVVVYYDTKTQEFDHWVGDGDNKARGFMLETGSPYLPCYIESVTVAEDN